MASFRKRNDRWQVQIRRLGHPPISRSFIKKADADSWARLIEGQLDRSDLPIDPKQLRTITLGDLLKRYRDTVTVKKRGSAVERIRIDKIIRHEIGLYSLARVTPSSIASYRDERLKQVKPETVRRELTILRHLFEVARKDWGVRTTSNPVAQITKPAPARARERRLQKCEYEKLLTACKRSRSKQLPAIMKLAVETGTCFGNLKINECWAWEGDTQQSEWGPIFGAFLVQTPSGPFQAEAHRISLIFENQTDLANGTVGHRCVEYLCVNPTHLAEMTKSDVFNRWVHKTQGPFREWPAAYRFDGISTDHRSNRT